MALENLDSVGVNCSKSCFLQEAKNAEEILLAQSMFNKLYAWLVSTLCSPAVLQYYIVNCFYVSMWLSCSEPSVSPFSQLSVSVNINR